MLTRKDLGKKIHDLYMLISDKIKIDGIYLLGLYPKGNPRKDSNIDIAILPPVFEGIRFIDNSKISRIIINETYPHLPF